MQYIKSKEKVSFLQNMLIYDDFINWKSLSYLAWVPSLKSINSSSLSRKKYDGDNFNPTLVHPWELIERTESSDILNYKSFFKHCILKAVLLVFLLLIFVSGKVIYSNLYIYIYIYIYIYCSILYTFFGIGLGWHSVLQYQRFCVFGALFMQFL